MYIELEYTVYFVSNGDLTIDYHRFPNGFNTFYGHPQHPVVSHTQLTLIAFLRSLNELVYFMYRQMQKHFTIIFSRSCNFLQNSQKFCPSKISGYTVVENFV